MKYQQFIEAKSQLKHGDGFKPIWMSDHLYDFQAFLVDWALRCGRGAIFADCGLGKGQPYGSNVLTSTGWTEIQDLNVGDLVVASDGLLYPVTGVYPKQKQDTHRIHFSDGASFVVDEDHLHIVRTNNDRQRGKPWRVLSTRKLLESNLRYGKAGKSRNYDIPVIAPVEFGTDYEDHIKPYTLGVLLGDGHLKGNVGISSADQEIIERVRRDNGRWIDRIEYEGRQPTVCISVASPDSSYVTDHFIVTHNTLMQLVWAENVKRHTNKPVLILTPLAVSAQTVKEAEKFGIECKQSRDGIVHKITVTNYERLHYFRSDDFAGVVCDESSAIKAFDGKRRKQVTRFLSKIPYRLLCTATAAPNDYIELGTSSEALGVLTQSEMLSRFFKSDDKQRHTLFREGDFWNRDKWFFRAHSETPFWRWVCSWARALQKPSDVGFDDTAFLLPPLNIHQHVINAEYIPPGELFPRIAKTLREQREERKRTINERCERVADLVDHNESVVVWCQYNNEGDMLEKIIPGAVQVAGRNSDDEKESRLNAFSSGEIRVLVTKQKIAGWGLNWQHCGHQVMFPSHSFEGYYQAIRRSWRFGRKGPVSLDIVTTIGEQGVTKNLEKKQKKADMMFTSLVMEMQNEYKVLTVADNHTKEMEVPSWL